MYMLNTFNRAVKPTDNALSERFTAYLYGFLL